MQTSIINIRVILSVCILLVLYSPVQANTHFSELFMMDSNINQDLSDRVSQYHSQDISLNLDRQEQELLNIDSQLNSIKKNNTDNPTYWFIKGLNHSNLASVYSSKKLEAQTGKHLQQKDLAYETAMNLDKKQQQLSAAIYNTMKHGLPQDLKIEATQSELKLGGNGYSDSYYWYLHWSNIDQLKKAGRHEEAQAAFEQMQKELKNSDMDPNIYGSLTKSIEKKTFNKQDKPEPVKPRPKPKQQEPEKQEPETSMIDNQFILIALVIAAILLTTIVTIYELVIKKKRK